MVVGLALVAVPSAAASCRSEIGKGARVVEQSRKAVVYSRKETSPNPVFGTQRIYYGCEFRTARLVRLNKFTDFGSYLSDWALAGRFVAFSFWAEEGASSESIQSIHVYNLRNGTQRRGMGSIAEETTAPGNSERVLSLVLKPNASIAWIASFVPEDDEAATHYQVNKVETERDDRLTTLDQGPTVRPRSLALSQDRKTVYWQNGATTRSARLR
jgi:hypothetical protein